MSSHMKIFPSQVFTVFNENWRLKLDLTLTWAADLGKLRATDAARRVESRDIFIYFSIFYFSYAIMVADERWMVLAVIFTFQFHHVCVTVCVKKPEKWNGISMKRTTGKKKQNDLFWTFFWCFCLFFHIFEEISICFK